MGRCFSKMYGIILCLWLLFFYFSITSSHLMNLKSENANAKTLVDDLVAGMRGVFAVGRFRNKLTLFISGTGSMTDPNGGYQVTVDKVVNSVITISQDPEPLPSGIDWLEHSIKFVCSDSTGTYLVTMNKEKAGALSLDKKNFIDVMAGQEPGIILYCSQWRSLHVSTHSHLQFYLLNFRYYGKTYLYIFLKGQEPSPETTLSTATNCGYDDPEPLGFLCVNGDQVVFSKEQCDFTFITDIVSGFVDKNTVYLFSKNNTVYTFSAKVFQKNGPSAKLIKASRDDAWKGPKGNEPSPSKSTDETTSKQANQTNQGFSLVIIVSTGFLVLLIIGISIVLYCCFCGGNDKKTKSKKYYTDKVEKKVTKKKISKSKKKTTISAGFTSNKKKKKKVKRSFKKGKSSRSHNRVGKSSRQSSSKQNKFTSSRKSSKMISGSN